MSAVLTPPAPATPPGSHAPGLPAPGPRPRLWTVAEFHDMGDRGLFEGRRAKLIHGVIVEEGPMDPPHRIALELTDAALRAAFGGGWRFCVQLPLVLGLRIDPEPDLAVVAGSIRAAGLTHPTTAALVVEIADSSLGYDTRDKAELYATAGLADYWVVDVDGRELHVFRDPQPLPATLGGAAYRTHTVHTPGQSVAPLAAPNSPVPVADLLP